MVIEKSPVSSGINSGVGDCCGKKTENRWRPGCSYDLDYDVGRIAISHIIDSRINDRSDVIQDDY